MLENDLQNFKNALVNNIRDFVLSNFDLTKNNDAGIIKNTAKTKNGVKRLTKNWNNILDETDIFNNINTYVNNLDDNVEIVKKDFEEAGLTFTLQDVDLSFLETQKQIIKNELNNIFNIGGVVYNDVITVVTNSLFQDNFTVGNLKENLTGLLPTTLQRYAQTYANTINFEYQQIIKDFAVSHIQQKKLVYKYSGRLQDTSRVFCIARLNNYYTKEEIQKWSNESWQGKKQGSVFIVRGGWNCTHLFNPVPISSLTKKQERNIDKYNINGQYVDYNEYLNLKTKIKRRK